MKRTLAGCIAVSKVSCAFVQHPLQHTRFSSVNKTLLARKGVMTFLRPAVQVLMVEFEILSSHLHMARWHEAKIEQHTQDLDALQEASAKLKERLAALDQVLILVKEGSISICSVPSSACPCHPGIHLAICRPSSCALANAHLAWIVA